VKRCINGGRTGEVNPLMVLVMVLAAAGLIAAYCFYARADDLRSEVELTQAEQRQAQSRLSSAKKAVEDWEKAVGVDLDVARAKVESFQPKLVAPRENFAGLVLTLEEKRREADYLLEVARDNLLLAEKDLEAVKASYDASRREKEREHKVLKDRLSKATAELRSVEGGFRAEIRRLQQNRSRSDRALRQLREELEEKEREYDLEVQRLKIELRAKLEVLRSRMQEFIGEADGEILFVDAVLNVVTINIGAKHGVKDGMVFKVYRRDETGERVDKGRVRVRKTDEGVAVAAVVNTLPKQGMIPGDLIESPLFPEGARFCIIGLFPRKEGYVYTFEELVKDIEKFGGIVVKDVTLETDYIIQGYSVSYASLDLSRFLRIEGQEFEDLRPDQVYRALGRELPEQTLEAVATIMDSDVQRRNDSIELQVPLMTVEEFLEYFVR